MAVPPRYIQKMALAVSIFQKVLPNSIFLLFFIAAILKLLGTSTNQVEEKFKKLTSDQRINEDLLVKWFQVSIATLIMFSEEKNG